MDSASLAPGENGIRNQVKTNESQERDGCKQHDNVLGAGKRARAEGEGDAAGDAAEAADELARVTGRPIWRVWQAAPLLHFT